MFNVKKIQIPHAKSEFNLKSSYKRINTLRVQTSSNDKFLKVKLQFF